MSTAWRGWLALAVVAAHATWAVRWLRRSSLTSGKANAMRVGMKQLEMLDDVKNESTVPLEQKIKIAISRLQMFLPDDGQPYWFADSYGKDSCVVRQLLIDAGTPYEGHHNLTTCDAPQTVQFGRHTHTEVQVDRPEKNIFQLIEKEGVPAWNRRWCCRLLKERARPSGRTMVLGVRAGESHKRSRRSMIEKCHKDPTVTYLNPIIDWTDEDVWEFIRQRKIPYCGLYDEGFNRLGCVICPQAPAHMRRNAEKFPKLAAAYQKAIAVYWNSHPKAQEKWSSPHEFWEWWITPPGKRQRPNPQEIEAQAQIETEVQCEIFGGGVAQCVETK